MFSQVLSILASSASCHPVFPLLLLFVMSVKQKGGAQFWERGTFLNNGLTAGSKLVHDYARMLSLNVFLTCCHSLLFLSSLFPEEPLCFSSLPHTFVHHGIKEHFLCLSGFLQSGYDLHVKWLRMGPLPIFLPLSHHSFIPNSSHLCPFLALCCALYKRAA